jgi:hypothetical protein
MLAAEGQRVINLRLAAIAGGGPAAELEAKHLEISQSQSSTVGSESLTLNTSHSFSPDGIV